MDDNTNDEEYQSDIRPPDKSIYEKLVDDDDISDFDKEMEQAIQISMKVLVDEDAMNRDYETKLLETYEKIRMERKEQCREILLDIGRLTRYDKDMREIYDIIDPILEYYCAQNIDFYELDIESYNRIFGLLDKLRTNQKNIEFLKTVLTHF